MDRLNIEGLKEYLDYKIPIISSVLTLTTWAYCSVWMGTELRQDCYCVLLLLRVSSHVVVILSLNCDYNEDTTLDCAELVCDVMLYYE